MDGQANVRAHGFLAEYHSNFNWMSNIKQNTDRSLELDGRRTNKGSNDRVCLFLDPKILPDMRSTVMCHRSNTPEDRLPSK